MDLQLTGKTALVTGSTAGIGLAIAEGLVRVGAGDLRGQRVGGHDAAGDDPLRDDEVEPTGAVARAGGDDEGDAGHRQYGPAGADAVGGDRRIPAPGLAGRGGRGRGRSGVL